MKCLFVFITTVFLFTSVTSNLKSQTLSDSSSLRGLTWSASASIGIGGPGSFENIVELALRLGANFNRFYVGGAFSIEREQRFPSRDFVLTDRILNVRSELGYSLINTTSFQLRPYIGFGVLFTTFNPLIVSDSFTNPVLQSSEWRTMSSSYLSPGVFSTLFPFSQLPVFLAVDVRYEIFFSRPPTALYRLVGSAGFGVVF